MSQTKIFKSCAFSEPRFADLKLSRGTEKSVSYSFQRKSDFIYGIQSKGLRNLILIQHLSHFTIYHEQFS